MEVNQKLSINKIQNDIYCSIPYFNFARYRIIYKSRFSSLFEKLKLKEIVEKYEANYPDDMSYGYPRKKNSPIYPITIKDIQVKRENKTTVALRNLPKEINIKQFVKILDEHSITNYNLIVFPTKVPHNCGFALVNFTEPKYIINFYQRFNSRKFPGYDNVIQMIYSHIQGIRKIRKFYLPKFIFYFPPKEDNKINESIVNELNENLKNSI